MKCERQIVTGDRLFSSAIATAVIPEFKTK